MILAGVSAILRIFTQDFASGGKYYFLNGRNPISNKNAGGANRKKMPREYSGM